MEEVSRRMNPARLLLIAEFILLCVALPTAVITFRLAHFMFAFLWGATLYCGAVLRWRYHDHLKSLWKGEAVCWRTVRFVLLRWALVSVAIWAFTAWYDPARLFLLPRERPQILLILVFGYPLLSALPQEFIFCSFFFKRYEALFGRGRLMIFMSALVFGFAHMLYLNPVAPVIAFTGGLIFAWSYARHHSLALVTIEHGLYGISLFFIGLGWYFYSGAVVP